MVETSEIKQENETCFPEDRPIVNTVNLLIIFSGSKNTMLGPRAIQLDTFQVNKLQGFCEHPNYNSSKNLLSFNFLFLCPFSRQKLKSKYDYVMCSNSLVS